MRVREVLFSTSLCEIDLARWCINHLTGHGEDRFYLRWNPETLNYAVPVHKAQDLKNIRNNERLKVERLASRILIGPAPRPARAALMPPTLAPEPMSVDPMAHRAVLEAKSGLIAAGQSNAHGLGSALPIRFAATNS